MSGERKTIRKLVVGGFRGGMVTRNTTSGGQVRSSGTRINSDLTSTESGISNLRNDVSVESISSAIPPLTVTLGKINPRYSVPSTRFCLSKDTSGCITSM